jgi:hypothetical protein
VFEVENFLVDAFDLSRVDDPAIEGQRVPPRNMNASVSTKLMSAPPAQLAGSPALPYTERRLAGGITHCVQSIASRNG